MKSIITFISIFCACFLSYSQVGIGTSSPLGLLHLKASVDDTSNSHIRFESLSGTQKPSITVNNDGKFYMGSAASYPTGGIVIDLGSYNYVGVGTNTPSNRFHVKGANPLTIETLSSLTSVSSTDRIMVIADTGVVKAIPNNNYNTIATVSSGEVSLDTNVTVLVGGNISIPTASGNKGKVLYLVNNSGNTRTVTGDFKMAGSTTTIASIVLDASLTHVRIQSDGVVWWVY